MDSIELVMYAQLVMELHYFLLMVPGWGLSVKKAKSVTYVQFIMTPNMFLPAVLALRPLGGV